jgi:hypothetical protein
MNGINPEIENSLYLDDILIQASDEIQDLKDRLEEAKTLLSYKLWRLRELGNYKKESNDE